MHTLYWIHSPDMTDPFTQGYVGITCRNPKTRLEEHFHNNEIIAKHRDDVVMTILSNNLTEKGACALEKKYRPNWYIGWNIAIGGDLSKRPPGIHTRGWHWSESSKKKQSERMKGLPKSPDHRQAIRESHKSVSFQCRAKISATLRGRKLSLSTRQKIATIMTGKKRGPYKKHGQSNN